MLTNLHDDILAQWHTCIMTYLHEDNEWQSVIIRTNWQENDKKWHKENQRLVFKLMWNIHINNLSFKCLEMTNKRLSLLMQKRTKNGRKWHKMTQKMIENDSGNCNIIKRSEKKSKGLQMIKNDKKWQSVIMRKNDKKLLKMTKKATQIRSKTDVIPKYLLFNL